MRHDLFRFSGHDIAEAAILLSREGLGTHTGIVYRDEAGELQRLDFYLDGTIGNRQWKGKRAHVVPNADDDALANISSVCRVVARRYGWIPRRHLFAFRRSNAAFINPVTGELYLGEVAGASCASFVLLILFAAGVDLVVSAADWPHRPADDARHAGLLAELERHFGNDPNYLARVRSELPCPRVAPEEIAGAAMFPDLLDRPADQTFAERAGKWIVGLFDHNDNFLDNDGALIAVR
jgi:hypothetical protein